MSFLHSMFVSTVRDEAVQPADLGVTITNNFVSSYDVYMSTRAPGRFEVVHVDSFNFPHDPLFRNRHANLLRLLGDVDYKAENPWFHEVSDNDAVSIYTFKPVGGDGFTLPVAAVIGYDLMRDPIVEFVRALGDVSPASFAARYVVHGITANDAEVMVHNLVSGIRCAWPYGVPLSLSGMAITRESVEKAVSHLNLNGTYLYPEKLRLNNFVNSYNPFRKEIRATRGCGGGLVKHCDFTFNVVNGYYVPDNYYDTEVSSPLDAYLNPEEIISIVLGENPLFSPYLGSYVGREGSVSDQVFYSCVAARNRFPATIIRRRCIDASFNTSLAVVKDSIGHLSGVWVSPNVRQAVWQVIGAPLTEYEWCALMSCVPGLADSYNAAVDGRFYYDPLASKAIACSLYYDRERLQGQQHRYDCSAIYVVDGAIGAVSGGE